MLLEIEIENRCQWSGVTLAHKSYDADVAFGPDVSNDVVYERTVAGNDVGRHISLFILRKIETCRVDAEPRFIGRNRLYCRVWTDRFWENIYHGTWENIQL